jgi:hypothetical protein
MTYIGPKIIVVIFNAHTKTIIHVFLYKSHSTSHPTIILGDFNIDMTITGDDYSNSPQQELVESITTLNVKIHIHTYTTSNGSILYHILIFPHANEFLAYVLEGYYPNYHKPIYVAFKLPNSFPMHNK